MLNRKESKVDVFNDRFAGVVAFYRCIRDPQKLEQLQQQLELMPHAREEFLWCKETWENAEDDVQRAARWYYMINNSFLGKGTAYARSMNTRFTSGIEGMLPLFPAIHYRYKRVEIENLDWRQCIEDYDDVNTVFYLDPPYLGTDTGVYKHKFTRQDHVELLERIQLCQGFVALSGYANDLYDSYKWDARYEWQVDGKALALSFLDNGQEADKDTRQRKKVTEVLWLKE